MRAQETKIYDSGNNPVNLQSRFAEAVTASDTTVLQPGILYIGTTGNIVVKTAGGDTVTFTNVPDGAILPVLVTMVLSTDTTASNIVIMR